MERWDGMTNSTLMETPLKLEPRPDGPLPPAIETSIAEPTITDKEFEDSMARLGHNTVSGQRIKDLSACGIYVRGVGVLNTMRGKAILNQHRFERLLDKIVTEFEKISAGNDKGKIGKMERLAKSLAILGSKLTESQRLMVEMQPGNAPGMPPVDDSMPVNQSFAPGQRITPGNTLIAAKEVHLHR
jgi:hypothetical protein